MKDSPQVSSCWLFFETIIMMHGTMNVKKIVALYVLIRHAVDDIRQAGRYKSISGWPTVHTVHGDSRWQVHNLGAYSIGHVRKKVRMNT